MKDSIIYQETEGTTNPSFFFEQLMTEPTRQTLNRLIYLTSNLLNTWAVTIYFVEDMNAIGKNSISVLSPYRSEKEQLFIRWLSEEIHANDALPTIVEDTWDWDFMRDHPIIEASKIRSYFCIPLMLSPAQVVGNMCIMDYRPREWQMKNIQIVDELTRSMMSEIKLRNELNSFTGTKEKLIQENHQFSRALKFTESTIFNMKGIIERGANPKEIAHYLDAMQELLACIV